uniref:Uncharacterized protein n=1 Tax=Arundo donax TaxID=35708 RepID=A0A0A9DYM2_ARUDO
MIDPKGKKKMASRTKQHGLWISPCTVHDLWIKAISQMRTKIKYAMIENINARICFQIRIFSEKIESW